MIFDKIIDVYDSFTKTEKKIADYVMKKPQKVLELSISDLCNEVGAKSEASVVKFYRKIDLESFQQFKVLLAQNIANDPVQLLYEDVSLDDDVNSIVEKTFKASARAVLDSLKKLDIKALEKAVELFSKASFVIFFGYGASAAVALDAYHKFVRIGKKSIFSNDSHINAMQLAQCGPDDLFVVISHSGETKELIELVDQALENGIKVVGITGNPHSTIARKVTVCLSTFTREMRFRTDAMTSRIAQLTILDSIYTCLAVKNVDYSTKALNRSKLAVSKLKK
ncbi:transcriptional regulator [Kosmotoga arenicorallina S304]|uniref:Transcriptional regulator n=1 Tax=Kosmotoga arenicorallina S304 TaxID=1453497 RepID=A0A176JUI7_9BACT|nr:MurR/RpiR family transcriptional regulator [Kosmotoga arenicorallina]OAA27118.1 transcriptional regulator [Kosmotoga arenicorallina S304]